MNRNWLATQRVMASEYMRNEITALGAYHDHKEQMAYAATALFLTGATALSLAQLPRWIVCAPPAWLLLLVVSGTTAIAGIAFVAWQLRLRSIAADRQLACGMLAMRWLTNPPEEDRLRLPEDLNSPPLLPALSAQLRRLPPRPLRDDPRVAGCLTIVPMVIWAAVALGRVLFAPVVAGCFR